MAEQLLSVERHAGALAGDIGVACRPAGDIGVACRPATLFVAAPVAPLRRLLRAVFGDPSDRGASGQRHVGQAFVAPAMCLIAFVLVAPTIYGFYYSLHDIKYLRATDFVGAENYTYLVTEPRFGALILRSFVFVVCAVSLSIGIALPVAMWIDNLKGWFALCVQIFVLLPWIVSSIVGALLYQWVFVSDIGWGTYILGELGLTNFRPLNDATSAMAVLVLFAVWRTLGFSMLLLLSGLKSISVDYYEAAHIDGASAWQRFTSITLPMLRTPLMITLVILTVSNLNNVEGPLVVTAGGPFDATDVLPLDLYRRAFAQFDFNSAIALGIGMFAANILLAMVYVRLVSRNNG